LHDIHYVKMYNSSMDF